MGCDIHMFAERKGGDGKWRKIGNEFQQETYENDTGYYRTDEVYDGRDYELFAFLADVRNNNNIEPISAPRGIPSDASGGYKDIVADWGYDGHSHSYFTIKELKEVLKGEKIKQEVDDGSLIILKDKNGNITATCQQTNKGHYGRVGKRKLFKLFGDNNPIQDIVDKFKYFAEEDDELRIVFFFDN